MTPPAGPDGAPSGAGPALSVVVLTWNEAPNIGSCLDSLRRQTNPDFEVIVIDAASTDGTDRIVSEATAGFPVPLRLEVAASRISVGEARNRGASLAHAPIIAFLSADAEADPRWVAEILHSMGASDLVFGRQVHAPASRGVGAAVRGLRYHFPDGPVGDPRRYASNVNAAFRREVLQAFPFGTSAAASAVDDLLLTERSTRAGHRIAYNPRMLVRHRDVASARAELKKNLREGEGWGAYVAELGPHRSILAWSLLLGVAVALVSLRPTWATVLALGAVLWLPALRRVWRRRHDQSARDLFLGGAASPLFDLAFLLAYLHGLLFRRGEAAPRPGDPQVPT